MITVVGLYEAIIAILATALLALAVAYRRQARHLESLTGRCRQQAARIRHHRRRADGYLADLDAVTITPPRPAPVAPVAEEPTPLIGEAFDLSASVLADLAALPTTDPGDLR